MTYPLEKLKEKYKTLPKDLQEAILSINSNEILREITQKNKLHIDQAAEMSDETGLVILGLTHPSQYVSNLEKRLNLSTEKVKEIATEINERIFKEIKESLKKIHGIDGSSSPEIVDKKPEDILELKSVPEGAELKRDDVLKELEEPEKAPVSTPSIPASSQLPAIIDEKLPTVTENKEGKDLVESQLENTSTIPRSESTIEIPEKKKYVVDPYREPIE